MSASRTQTRASQSRTAQSVGDELRNYKLHERIGQGELATIYSATHLGLDRPVHMHILRRTDWISVSRFQLAARLAARLSHPNLLPVIDAGHDDHFGDYLVTPMLNARPLAALLEEGPIEPLPALRITTQIATVLDYLYENNVIHRDVQPVNILVTPQGVAYLTNLSLAASPDTPDLSSIDEADYLTPYSAPEQRLDQGDATAALDIYGLGAVLYHMFSGELPPPPEMERPSLVARDPAFEPVDHVIGRMLAVEPAVRFPNATAAATALRQSLRAQIDLATDDMEESRWAPTAEWLENPLETVLGEMLAPDFVSRSRKRADDLHRANVLRRLLNRWSRDGRFRRTALGQLLQPDQIVSYNIYFYELRTLYETRTPPEPRRQPQQENERSATLPMPDLWDTAVPDMPPFTSVAPQEMVLPNSMRVLTCPECQGVGRVACPTCEAKGTVEKTRRVRNADGSSGEEAITQPCPACRGYGRQNCTVCQSSGNLVEEQVFTWSRQGRVWENTDDLEGLPTTAIKQRLELVNDAPINLYEGRWHSVEPLAALLRSAIANAGDDTRLVEAELSIWGSPITEVDYQLNETLHTLYLIGFDNEILGDWTLLNPERVILAVVLSVLLLLMGIALIVQLF
jgi:serine/threonine protein kinase